MIIRLHEIPKEGKHYHIDRQTGELNEVLADIIGDKPYETDVKLMPIGQAIDLTGEVKTSIPEVCSFCAKEFELQVDEKFHELILKDEARKLTGVKDFSPTEDVSVSVASPNLTYNLGEFIHEIVAMAEPYQPLCRQDCKGLCGSCGANLNEEKCRCAQQENKKESPFSVLKKLKFN